MRNAKYPVMAPGPTERLINPDGTATPALQSILEALVNQSGGQGQDAVYDLAQQQTILDGLIESTAQLEDRISILANVTEGQTVGLLATRDSLGRDLADPDFAGTVASIQGATVDMVKTSVSTPSKAVADYKTVYIRTENFKVEPGDRLEIAFSWKFEAVQGCFEHFSVQETVEIMQGQTATVANTVSTEAFPFSTTGNTGYVSNSWSGDVNKRFGETITVDVPDILTSPWPSDGELSVRLTIAPATNADGTNCIVGGTFSPSLTKTYFKLANRRITVRKLPKEITELIG